MQISKITKSLGTLTLANFARKHAEKLAANSDDEVKEQADRVMPAVESLEQAYAARRPLLALWSAATVQKNDADERLDDALRALSYELLGPSYLNKDRSASAYRVLFPSGNLAFISGPDRSQLAQVKAMVSYLQANADHPMTGRASDLAAKAVEVEEWLASAASAEVQFRGAQALESEMRQKLGRALRKSTWFLRDVFDGDESKVDKLFVSVAEAKVEDAVEEPTPV